MPAITLNTFVTSLYINIFHKLVSWITDKHSKRPLNLEIFENYIVTDHENENHTYLNRVVYEILSESKYLPIEFVIENIDKPWNYLSVIEYVVKNDKKIKNLDLVKNILRAIEKAVRLENNGKEDEIKEFAYFTCLKSDPNVIDFYALLDKFPDAFDLNDSDLINLLWDIDVFTVDKVLQNEDKYYESSIFWYNFIQECSFVKLCDNLPKIMNIGGVDAYNMFKEYSTDKDDFDLLYFLKSVKSYENVNDINSISINWYDISKKKSTTLELVMDNPSFPWDWNRLAHNNNFHPDEFVKFYDHSNFVVIFSYIEVERDCDMEKSRSDNFENYLNTQNEKIQLNPCPLYNTNIANISKSKYIENEKLARFEQLLHNDIKESIKLISKTSWDWIEKDDTSIEMVFTDFEMYLEFDEFCETVIFRNRRLSLREKTELYTHLIHRIMRLFKMSDYYLEKNVRMFTKKRKCVNFIENSLLDPSYEMCRKRLLREFHTINNVY